MATITSITKPSRWNIRDEADSTVWNTTIIQKIQQLITNQNLVDNDIRTVFQGPEGDDEQAHIVFFHSSAPENWERITDHNDIVFV